MLTTGASCKRHHLTELVKWLFEATLILAKYNILWFVQRVATVKKKVRTLYTCMCKTINQGLNAIPSYKCPLHVMVNATSYNVNSGVTEAILILCTDNISNHKAKHMQAQQHFLCMHAPKAQEPPSGKMERGFAETPPPPPPPPQPNTDVCRR